MTTLQTLRYLVFGVLCALAPALLQAQPAPRTRAQALQALTQPAPPTRLAGVQRLGEIGTMPDADRLVAMLRDDDAKVRLYASVSMWQIWSRSGDRAVDVMYQRGIDQMEASLRKMRRPSMDLMQIHNLVDWSTHLKTLRQWKASGRIRYIGITHYKASAHEELERILRAEPLDFVQFNYSIRVRDAEHRLLDAARDRGVAVLVNEPFERGTLFQAVQGKALPGWAADYEIRSWAEYFLKYLLGHPAVTCIIPGTSEPGHLESNLRAGIGPVPEGAARAEMLRYLERL